MKLLGVSGSLIGEKTAIAVNEVLKRAKELEPKLEIELIDMKELNVEFVTGKPFDQYNQDTQMVITKIKEADLFVIGTPIYQASITGALKNLFDHLPTNVFESKVVGTVTTAGSDKHFLVADNQLKPILSFFKAITPTNVFVHSSCFDQNNVITNEEVNDRIDTLAKELVTLHTKLKL
ncbi:NADPH-dependent FMN reductase [Halalkalibacter krulwichiae]|uniref:NAD(P)H-dependent FAD/FMN reductase n=1 Tax=Halalkalibacter krulwichiae TaxID=199441 RepID=A0A1X9MAI8_9BACI|nr:NADPH-dependent FMN reductase [Halalkalibacter krulwichiae]ARK30469.1 NAD(P)H-dependent FAD/FMN reductase [Halalkalibacter krulwichiae]